MLTGINLLLFMILAYIIVVPFIGLLIDLVIDAYRDNFGPF